MTARIENEEKTMNHRQPFAITWPGIVLQLFVVAVLIYLTIVLWNR
jgi:hypothetical protein